MIRVIVTGLIAGTLVLPALALDLDDDVLAFEKQHGRIQPGAIVLLRTFSKTPGVVPAILSDV